MHPMDGSQPGCAIPMSADRWSPATRLAALARLRAAREPFYAAADVRVESAGTARTVATTIVDAVGERRPAARRLFDARTRRDHPMGPREARIVYGRDLDAATLEPLVDGLSTGEPVVVADERAAEALPGLMAALPGERQLAHHGRRAGQADELRGAAAGGGRGHARRARRCLDRGRWRHHR